MLNYLQLSGKRLKTKHNHILNVQKQFYKFIIINLEKKIAGFGIP